MNKPSCNLMVIVLFLGLTHFSATDVRPQPKPCNPQIEFPERIPSPGEVRFAAIGDTGTGDSAQRIFALKMYIFWLEKAKFDYLLFLGDNVYQFGNPDGFKKKLYDPYNELSMKGVLIKGVLGNHDVLNYKGSELQMKYFTAKDAADQRRFFEMPVKEQLNFPGSAKRYYKFPEKDNLVEFFALDSSMLIRDCCGFLFWKRKFTKEETSKHVEWLKTELEKSTAKWKVVVLHHPFYSSALGHGVKVGKDQKEKIPEKMARLRIDQEGWENIETILVNSGVDLVVAGHDHVYERISPQKGIAHFVSGAGAKLRKKDFNAELPTFHGCGDSKKLSFMLFSVQSDAITFWAIDEDSNPFDHGTIRKRSFDSKKIR